MSDGVGRLFRNRSHFPEASLGSGGDRNAASRRRIYHIWAGKFWKQSKRNCDKTAISNYSSKRTDLVRKRQSNRRLPASRYFQGPSSVSLVQKHEKVLRQFRSFCWRWLCSLLRFPSIVIHLSTLISNKLEGTLCLRGYRIPKYDIPQSTRHLKLLKRAELFCLATCLCSFLKSPVSYLVLSYWIPSITQWLANHCACCQSWFRYLKSRKR